jgi:hypothetical protein
MLQAARSTGGFLQPDCLQTNIANPVALYNAPSEGIYYKVLVYNEAAVLILPHLL